MAEKITEEQVANLIAVLRTDALVDAKVHQINGIKSAIKQLNVPDNCVAPLFEVARMTITSQHAPLVNAGFSTLNHLLVRLSLQEPKHLQREAARTLPLVVEKAGDPKDKYRQLAVSCLTTLWRNKTTAQDVERIIKNVGMVGRNPRMKETSMKFIAQMHREHGMPFKFYVTNLMELLEDADGMVRGTARDTVIELFRDAPNPVKADLKKQLKIYNVRPAIAQAIENQLVLNTASEAETFAAEPVLPSRFASSVSSVASHRPSTPPSDHKIEHVEPSYVHTQRELEDIFRDMHAHFDGRESEANWMKREQSCVKLRRLNAGNAPMDYPDAFVAGLKSLLDGLLKAVNSLRTSLSKEGCSVIQEVARTFGPGIDSMVELLLQNLIKLCAGTKKISSQQGNTTVDIIISKVSYNARIMQHIWFACQDKNVQPRTYATGWLRTVLKKEAQHKSHVEHNGGLDLVEKCLKKGLADANPGVRESMRSTYWAFAQIWPVKAEGIMSTLDATQQRLLENAPDNPNSPQKADVAKSRPGLGFSKSTNAPPKPSLKELMLKQKATMAPRNIPARPGSAMSALTPSRTVSVSSTTSTRSEAVPTKRGETASTRSGLHVAPMRPAQRSKRVDPPRPQTAAGSYPVRRPGHAPSSSDSAVSPSTIKSIKTRTPTAPTVVNTSPSKKLSRPPRPNTSHSHHEPAQTSPGRKPTKHAAASPVVSPKKSGQAATINHSPTRADEELTMVMPNLANIPDRTTSSRNIGAADIAAATPTKVLQVYEDPFTAADDQTTPRPMIISPVLAEVQVNDDAINQQRTSPLDAKTPLSPERNRQNVRLLDSGINKVKAKSLDRHGFRKIQGLIRDGKGDWSDRFDVLLLGLFEYLEAPVSDVATEKSQDIKAQILGTIKLMFKKDSAAFRPHVSRGLECLLLTRSYYDSQSHLVGGLELFARELSGLGGTAECINTIVRHLSHEDSSLQGARQLSMGMHVLKETMDGREHLSLSAAEVDMLRDLARRCLDRADSRVRMDAVLLCVSLHGVIGEGAFWDGFSDIKDDSKSLLTYYVATKGQKRQMSV